jgi:hypothetical protein
MLTHGNLKVLISALVLISNIIYEVKANKRRRDFS